MQRPAFSQLHHVPLPASSQRPPFIDYSAGLYEGAAMLMTSAGLSGEAALSCTPK
jgi:hypothetical protein